MAVPRVSRKKITRSSCHTLWSKLVRTRDGYRCIMQGVPVRGVPHVCSTSFVDAMHGFPKHAYPAVRFELWNGFAGCRAIHAYFHDREPEWQNHLRTLWGNALYEERLRLACQTAKWNLREVFDDFTKRLESQK